MAREIICINEDNVSTLLTDRFLPWLLQSAEGLYEVSNTVTRSPNTMTDGSTYQGSVTAERNIVLIMRDRPDSDHKANRELLYSIFKPKSEGTFIYTENGVTRSIRYYVEKIYIDSEKRSRSATISLICPDPFFTAMEDTVVKMAGWSAMFEWQHEFIDGGEELGARNNERLKAIDNSSAADNIGVTITIDAQGPVTNPTIYHVEQETEIALGTENNPLYLVTGDKLIITTHTNNKHVYLIHEGVKTEINEYLTEESEFIQLQHGINTFGYGASAGVAYVSVTISYRYQYLGV